MKNQNKKSSRIHNKMLWTIFMACIVGGIVMFGTLYSYHNATRQYPNMEVVDIEEEFEQIQHKINNLLLEEKKDILLVLERNMQRIDYEIEKLENKIENAEKKKKETLRNQLAEKRQEKKEFESAVQKVKTATAETWQGIKMDLEEWQSDILIDIKEDQS